MTNPYRSAPDRAFWSRSVARGFDPAAVVSAPRPLLGPADRVMSAGSCFAANLVPYIERAGFTYVRTEPRHAAFRALPPENLGYADFSAAYGHVYTARQLLQLLRRALGTFHPVEDRWLEVDKVVDPFRPGLRYAATSEREHELLTRRHLDAVRAAFEAADVLVFTLGLTDAWCSTLDGAVFPACPGVVAGAFDAERHVFVNFGVAEVIDDLDAFVRELRAFRPEVRLILTVSPVPLVATATASHVLAATVYSKSVLRVAADEIARRHSDVDYFPAYELVTGPQAPKAFFKADRRNVSSGAVDTVMDAFLHACGITDGAGLPAKGAAPADARAPDPEPRRAGASAQPAGKGHAQRDADHTEDAGAELSRRIADAECEEAMMDDGAPSSSAASSGD